MGRADDIFTQGPETLIAQTAAIIAGPVSNFSKRVTERSPDTPSGVPLRWVITGDLINPQFLKGEPTRNAVHFTRSEQAMFVPRPDPLPVWEQNIGEWQEGDSAVVFLARSNPPEIIKVLPSGAGDRDLISLVKEIGSIQSSDKPAPEKWQVYLLTANGDEKKKIALRSLVDGQISWDQLAPLLQKVMTTADTNLRLFTFGLIGYQVTHDKWSGGRSVVDFLCRQLERETDADVTAQYLSHFELMLRFASDEDFRIQRKELRERLRSCLEARCGKLPGGAAGDCADILTRYPVDE